MASNDEIFSTFSRAARANVKKYLAIETIGKAAQKNYVLLSKYCYQFSIDFNDLFLEIR